MYRGFNLKIKDELNKSEYFTTGKKLFTDYLGEIQNRIVDIIAHDGIINGNKVIEDWFPQIECDIFLSHSHDDQGTAFELAGYLKQNFGLTTFIDSTVWGFSNTLLKTLDDEYCLNDGGNTYNYNLRNYSTSHVHLMLKSALDKMIDSCEAVFFLNTPNSVSARNTVKENTKSPWIFSEIATTQIIRKKTPNRLKQETRLFSAKESVSMNENSRNRLSVEYELELNHFTTLDIYDLQHWKNRHYNKGENALDELYRLKPIDSRFLI
ncbi:hypothetical protein [Nonlabens ulvanivorans]|uniref:hypothetical protein n=1 Tax=Nonlabens ulvanivorans TaxID=906888 RepID=UPI003264D478